jgi:hypothetical protein
MSTPQETPQTGPEVTPVVPEPVTNNPEPAGGPSDALVQAQAEADKWKSFSRKHEETSKAHKAQLEQQQEILAQLAKAQGIDINGKPDPERLTQQLNESQAAQKQAAIELAVLRKAGTLNADSDALLDSRAFMDQVKGFDPSDSDFAANVEAAVRAAAESNPRYQVKQQRVTPPTQTSGADFSGAPSGERQWSQEDVNNATPDQLQKAMAKGLLKSLRIGPSKHRGRRG